MKKYIQNEFLKVSNFKAREWQHPVHNHNHFEMIFIHGGKGSHCVSGMQYPYDGKSLFLLAPCDFHYFHIEEETEFTFLKFTNVYLKSIENIQVQRQWNQEIDALLIQAGHQNTPLQEMSGEIEKLDRIVRLIVDEWAQTKSEANEAIYFLIQAMLSIVKRNQSHAVKPTHPKHSRKITEIVNYIHQHIYSVEMIMVDHLAEIFGYSKHYLGLFFREQTGTTLRDYINQYKLHLIEKRLQYSSLSIKEISNEFGFTDLSHFNKFFKKHKNIAPSKYQDGASRLGIGEIIL
jgi:AraC-like DNA-binding protein